MTTRKRTMSRSVDGLVRGIWADDAVLCLAFRDEAESIRSGHGRSEDHGCHDIEAFLRVIAEMKKRKIMRAEFRIFIPANKTIVAKARGATQRSSDENNDAVDCCNGDACGL